MDHQRPSLGRIVRYRLSAFDIEQDGAKLNGLLAGDTCAAMIVRVWNEEPGTCNLTLFPDSAMGTLWKTSVSRGEGPSQWNWPNLGQGVAMAPTDPAPPEPAEAV
jgi:hypothetical protein